MVDRPRITGADGGLTGGALLGHLRRQAHPRCRVGQSLEHARLRRVHDVLLGALPQVNREVPASGATRHQAVRLPVQIWAGSAVGSRTMLAPEAT
jgi:hypothetical protein